MNEEQAKLIAEIFGGIEWNSGGDIHLVRVDRHDGSFVVISDEVICEYKNEEAFENNSPRNSIIITP